jgi:hypothetical protein
MMNQELALPVIDWEVPTCSHMTPGRKSVPCTVRDTAFARSPGGSTSRATPSARRCAGRRHRNTVLDRSDPPSWTPIAGI